MNSEGHRFAARVLMAFVVVGVAAMALLLVTPAIAHALCTDCHSTSLHPAGANCVQCHPYGTAPLNRQPDTYDEHFIGQTNDECVSCHDATFGEHFSVPFVVGTVTVDGISARGNAYTCESCHNVSRPEVRMHPPHTGGLPEPACSTCHDDDVSLEHISCAVCHDSSSTEVVDAIAANDLSCSACHDLVTAHDPLHDDGISEVSCLECHYANTSAEHAGDCALCHESADPVVTAAIVANDVSCAACHDVAAGHIVAHNGGLAGSPCAQCHEQDNVSVQHDDKCAVCHESQVASVMNAVSSGDTRCTACHPSHGVGNRSSGYLSFSFAESVRRISGGGNKAAYVTWLKAVTDMTNAGVAASSRLTPHGDYATTTIKCQVCHSVHKASNSGSMLLMSADGGCVVCHGATSSVGSNVKVSADGLAADQGGFANEDTRHGKAGSCMDYECHATSPHGIGVSSYAAAKSALLSEAVDPLIAAALASGVASAPVEAVINDDWTASMGIDFAEVWVNQPQLKGADALAITAPTAATLARGRAIVTGYTCANNGCHINGSFNGVSADANFGAYRVTVGGVELANSSNYTSPSAGYNLGLNDMRDEAIKGHTLFTAANDMVGVETAYAASGTCKACHDGTDVRRANKNTFPHSNAVWAVRNASNDPTGTMAAYGYVKLYGDAAWFKVAGSLNQTFTATNGRQIPATTPTFGQALTVGMDGACLKCHRKGAVGAESGVGINY